MVIYGISFIKIKQTLMPLDQKFYKLSKNNKYDEIVFDKKKHICYVVNKIITMIIMYMSV